ACFIRAFGATYLGRARTQASARAAETDRWSLAAMLVCAALCLLAGVLPGFVIDWFEPAVWALVAGHMPPQAGIAWLSIIPVSASRSSYNGLLLFGFVAACAGLAAVAVHRFASRAVRTAPFWDCGYPRLSARAQYSATSLAQPIRRVFASVVFGSREEIRMPPPGSTQPATLRRFLRDPAWDFIYTPLVRAVSASATRLNRVQFFTIRRYLSLVFATL